MRKLIVSAFVSLDGIMQAPGGPEEDPTGGFAYGGWVFPYWDEEGGEAMEGIFGRPYDLLLGRMTYDIFAAYWPFQKNSPIGDQFNAVTKYVATSGNDPLTWAKSVKLEGDVLEAVARLKEGDGPDLLTQGSAMLVRALLAGGLVDELNLFVFPLLLGKGKKWVDQSAEAGEFALVSSFTTATGVIVSRYRPAGPVRTGSFADDEPSQAELARRAKMKAEG